MRTLTAFVLFLAVTNLCAQANWDTVKIRPQKITESIYILKGSGGNIGLLLGDDGPLLIDDQFAPLSDKIKEAVKSLGGGDVETLINTHIHGDHTGGNENFKNWGALIVAHDNVRKRMMVETKVRDRVVPPRDKAAWPVVTFPDRINFHWNGEDVELYHFANGHTDGDVIIKFSGANVFHAGDSFVRYGYPFVDLNSGGSINGFITNLDMLLGMMDDQSKVIPGHGDLATKADVKVFRDRIVELRDAVATALKKGTKKEDIGAVAIATKYDTEWGGGFVKGKDFVVMIAESLTAKN